MLHLIFQSPLETAVWERINSGDSVIFLENAALRLLKGSTINSALFPKTQHLCCYVLSDDIAVRGIDVNELIDGIEVIDYEKFVELTVNNRIIQSWT